MSIEEGTPEKLDEFIRRVLALSDEMSIRHVVVACSDAPDNSYEQPVAGTIKGSTIVLMELNSTLGHKIIEASAQAHAKRLREVGIDHEEWREVGIDHEE